MKMIDCLIQNKRRISRGLYLLAALIEQLPDTVAGIADPGRLPKPAKGRTLTMPAPTLLDQLQPKPKRKRRNGKK
jgi:hypothetical protein